MISCRELVDFLMDYLSGDLAEPHRTEFERHLAACPWCVAYMKTYQEAIKLGKASLASTDAPVPDEVPDDLVRAILAARRREP